MNDKRDLLRMAFITRALPIIVQPVAEARASIIFLHGSGTVKAINIVVLHFEINSLRCDPTPFCYDRRYWRRFMVVAAESSWVFIGIQAYPDDHTYCPLAV